MKKNLSKFLFVFCIFNCWLPRAAGQAVTNQGTEFWIAFPSHNPDFDSQFHPLPAQISIFITGGQASSGTVSAGSFSLPFTVSGNQVTEVKVPRESAYINDSESGQVLSGKAIHVTVDKGRPAVAVYAHIFAGQRSAASLILPAESLGSHYYSMNFSQHDTEGQNYIVLIATTPNTLVHIRKGNTELVPGGILLKKAGDIYEYLSSEDLTGASVSADSTGQGCNHFAMFSGSSGIYIAPAGCTAHSLDPLYQQCYDTQNWGMAYGFIPFSTQSGLQTKPVRTSGQFIRVLAGDQAATVSISGKVVANLAPGTFYTSPQPLSTPASITATGPVMVAQFALSQSCSNLGNTSYGFSDPDMLFLNPIDYSIRDITVYSSNRENISEQYLNILLPGTAAAGFRINGQAPRSAFKTMPGLPGFQYLQLDLSQENTHTFHLTAGEGFNAIAYGFGNVESYAYSAGTNLAASQTVNAIRTSDKVQIDSACVDEDFFFRLTLPYQSPRVVWKMDKTEAAVAQDSPSPVSISLHGKQAYVYQLAKTPAYLRTGDHDYQIEASYPAGLTDCSAGRQIITGVFRVMPLPNAAFSAEADSCGLAVRFKSKINRDTGSYREIWNFGDPRSQSANTSTELEPTHLYRDTGVYFPKLTIISASGCQITRTDTLHIHRNITADASFSATGCAGKAVMFTDRGKTSYQGESLRRWFFGDGASVSTTAVTVQHNYQNPGTYNVKLVSIAANGCPSDTSFRMITVTGRIIPSFSLPDICLSDGVARFVNTSRLPDGQTSGLSFLWRFGDSAATPNNPDTSVSPEPSHLFTAAKKYTVSLTISAPGYCDTTISRDFTVNGIRPKADFEVLSLETLCSGKPIQFRSLASVLDFGRISRLTWYFNADSDQADTLSVVHPEQGAIYSHTYPAFQASAGNAVRVVKLVVYSGNACADSLSKTITLLPVPALEFKQLGTICLDAPPFQITQAGELSGIKEGNSFYTGQGLSPAGIFDPAAAGVGLHYLTYHFIPAAGCPDSVSQSVNIVTPPTLEPPPNALILRGNSVILRPRYTGSGLSYKWTPAAGLDDPRSPFPSASPLTSTEYSLEVSNGSCVVSVTVRVGVLLPPVFSNAFSPNGDGVNDYWEIPNLATYPNSRVTIFNRYGIPVFNSTGYGVPWDGRYNGKDVPTGTYYYIVIPGTGQQNFSGNVIVIR